MHVWKIQQEGWGLMQLLVNLFLVKEQSARISSSRLVIYYAYHIHNHFVTCFAQLYTVSSIIGIHLMLGQI